MDSDTVLHNVNKRIYHEFIKRQSFISPLLSEKDLVC